MERPLDQSPQLWKTLATKECFNVLPWIRIFADTIQLPSQRVVEGFYRVQLPDYAMICARNPQGEFLLIRQYKHALGRVSLGLPAGCIGAGEDPFEAAQRELLEETGYAAGHWAPMGSFISDGNRGCCRAHFFLALDVEKVAPPCVDDMEVVETVFMPQEATMMAIEKGEIPVLAAVSLLAMASHQRLMPKEI